MHSLWCARDRMRDHDGYRPPEIMDRNVRPCWKKIASTKSQKYSEIIKECRH